MHPFGSVISRKLWQYSVHSMLRPISRPLIAALLLCAHALAAGAPSSGTAPLIFDGNHVFAELTFIRPGGGARKALVYVDTGSPGLAVGRQLLRDLQLEAGKPLRIEIGGMPITVNPKADVTAYDVDSIFPGLKVEAVLPASVLRNYVVVFDYANKKLTVAQPGALQPEGAAVPCRVNDKTGLAAVEIAVAGRRYPVAIDTGASYTWLSYRTVQEWLKAHPGWRRGTGAVGPANFGVWSGEVHGIVVRLPEVALGSNHLREVGAMGIYSGPPTGGEMFDWYSKKTPGPVVGFLGGNVLKAFRLTIDYPNHMTYWQQESAVDPHDLDQVGVTLHMRLGEYFVAGVASIHGEKLVDDVEPGDKLLRITEFEVTAASYGEVINALHGKPGDVRTLFLERDGHVFRVSAKVTRF